jgi:hypothetical protein
LKEFEKGSDIEEYIFKDKADSVRKILQNQTSELANSNKLQTLEKIQRFMPFDNF